MANPFRRSAAAVGASLRGGRDEPSGDLVTSEEGAARIQTLVTDGIVRIPEEPLDILV